MRGCRQSPEVCLRGGALTDTPDGQTVAEMRVIVAGSREISDFDEVAQAIEDSGFEVTELVSGCARGVDTLGEQWAEARGIPVKPFPADWDKHGKGAGHIRNREMSLYGDALVALVPADSERHPARGTRNMIAQAEKQMLPLHVRRVVMHQCHANRCQADAHPEAPFCQAHAKLLPKKLWQAIWKGRHQGECGFCDIPGSDGEPRIQGAPAWLDLVNVAIATLVVLEYDDCGAPEPFQDDESFCWCCGVQDHARTYERAQKAAVDARAA